MKVYMVWVYEWPSQMIIVEKNPLIESRHDRAQLGYRWQSMPNSRKAYLRGSGNEIKKIVDFFELEPDEMKEVELDD